MKITPSPAVIDALFANGEPGEVWPKVEEIILSISPSGDFSKIHHAYNDVIQLFCGGYPGYGRVKMLYHDLSHTLDVLLCAVRLMYGVHHSGIPLSDDELSIVMVGALMHDIGYAQREGEETGTGAQFTDTHVNRGIEFMQRYIAENQLPTAYLASLPAVMLCTDPVLSIDKISFPDERALLLGKILGTADIIGQMADRNYLDKLPFLFLEFKEGRVGNYRDVCSLLRHTPGFTRVVQRRLDEQFGGVYEKLGAYFYACFGVDTNYYMESIAKNLDYLNVIAAFDDETLLTMLKRAGVVHKFNQIAADFQVD